MSPPNNPQPDVLHNIIGILRTAAALPCDCQHERPILVMESARTIHDQ